MDQGFSPGENRQQALTLEKGFKFPEGSLQAVFEQQTAWKNNPLLPAHEYNSFSGDRLDEFNRGANRFKEKLDEFNGILPLAVDAYYRGDKATRRSLTEGFPSEATNAIHGTMAAMEKYGGEPYTPELQNGVSQHVGAATRSVEPERLRPPPEMFKGTQLFKLQDGTYKTNDALLNMFLDFESKGNASAQVNKDKPGTAKGLFQFIASTAARYGLYKEGEFDYRLDPYKNFQAAMELTRDEAKGLQNRGIPLTPGHFYLAHQQGGGGVSQIYNHITKGTPISAGVLKNMRNNWNPKWGEFSATNFYNHWTKAAADSYAKHAKENPTFLEADYALVGDEPLQLNDDIGSPRGVDLQAKSLAEQEAEAPPVDTEDPSSLETQNQQAANGFRPTAKLAPLPQAPINNVGPLRNAQLLNLNERVSGRQGLPPKAIRDVIRGIIQKSG